MASKTASRRSSPPRRTVQTKRAQQNLQRAPMGGSPNAAEMQQRLGNSGTQVWLAEQGGGQKVQAKLTVGEPGDMYEKEADAAASRIVAGQPVERVSRLPSGGLSRVVNQLPEQEEPVQQLEEEGEEESFGVQALPVQAKCIECEKEANVQRRESSEATPVSNIDTTKAETAMAQSGVGSPLSPALQAQMEEGFGADFSDVGVHTGSAADDAAQALNARAFTRGSDIYLAHNESASDIRLMGHELTHVVQQEGTKGLSFSRDNTADSKQVLHSDFQPNTSTEPKNSTSREGSVIMRRVPVSLVQRNGNSETLKPDETPDIITDVQQALDDPPTTVSGTLAMIERLLKKPNKSDPLWGTALITLWKSFGKGEEFTKVVSSHIDLWKKTVQVEPGFEERPEIKDIKSAFKNDVEFARDTYLRRNLAKVNIELERYPESDDIMADVKQPDITEELDTLRYVGSWIQKYKSLQWQLRTVKVGYSSDPDESLDSRSEDWDPSAEPGSFEEFFDPKRPAAIDADPDDTTMRPWREVKDQYDRLEALIARTASKAPVVYVLMRENKLDEVMNQKSAMRAREAIVEALRDTKDNVQASIENPLDYRKLTPVHAQMFRGEAPFETTQDWSSPLCQWTAKRVLSDYASATLWTDLMLATAQMALMAVSEIGTAGMATPLVLASLSVGAFQTGRKIDEAIDLSQAYNAAMADELRLVTAEDVDRALLDAVFESVSLFIDAYGFVGSFSSLARRTQKVAELSRAESRVESAVEIARLGRFSDETKAILDADPVLLDALTDNPVVAALLKRCSSPCDFPYGLSVDQVFELKSILDMATEMNIPLDKKALKKFLGHSEDIDEALSTLRWEIEVGGGNSMWDELTDPRSYGVAEDSAIGVKNATKKRKPRRPSKDNPNIDHSKTTKNADGSTTYYDKNGNQVTYNKYGYPDFSEYSIETIDDIPGMNGDYGHDSKLANEVAGFDETPDGYVWHHVEDGKKMELIPKEIHGNFPHTGGASGLKDGSLQ